MRIEFPFHRITVRASLYSFAFQIHSYQPFYLCEKIIGKAGSATVFQARNKIAPVRVVKSFIDQDRINTEADRTRI
jgi:hypothetical protein